MLVGLMGDGSDRSRAERMVYHRYSARDHVRQARAVRGSERR